MLVQNYGWPTGPAKIWLWLANRASQNMALAGPTAVWVASGHREARPLLVCFLKKIYVNFTRSCVSAQKALFYALHMLKEQNLTHPKAAKLATLNSYIIIYLSVTFG